MLAALVATRHVVPPPPPIFFYRNQFVAATTTFLCMVAAMKAAALTTDMMMSRNVSILASGSNISLRTIYYQLVTQVAADNPSYLSGLTVTAIATIEVLNEMLQNLTVTAENEPALVKLQQQMASGLMQMLMSGTVVS